MKQIKVTLDGAEFEFTESDDYDVDLLKEACIMMADAAKGTIIRIHVDSQEVFYLLSR